MFYTITNIHRKPVQILFIVVIFLELTPNKIQLMKFKIHEALFCIYCRYNFDLVL